MARFPWFASVLFLLPFPAAAQSFNIDIGDFGSQPHPSYGAAGSPGVWNSVTAANILPFTPGRTPQDDILVDLEGNRTNVGFHQSGSMETITTDDPSVSGPDAQLLNDYVVTRSAVVDTNIYLNGLENGVYEVITYAWMPNFPNNNQKVSIDFLEGCVVVGGVFNGHIEGVTYSRHVIDVTEGRIGVHCGIQSGGHLGIGAAVNGMQVKQLLGEDPITECGVGAVNAGRGMIQDVLLLNWLTGGSDHVVRIRPTDRFLLTIQEPNNRVGDLAPSRACIYAWAGPPEESDIVSLPLGLGNMCFGPFVLATRTAMRAWNALGRPNKLGVHTGPGPMPVIPDGEVHELLDLPSGVLQTGFITIQGIIEDDHSQGSIPLSVTNGFVVRID